MEYKHSHSGPEVVNTGHMMEVEVVDDMVVVDGRLVGVGNMVERAYGVPPQSDY